MDRRSCKEALDRGSEQITPAAVPTLREESEMTGRVLIMLQRWAKQGWVSDAGH